MDAPRFTLICCSVDPAAAEALRRNVAATIGEPFEFDVWDNRGRNVGLCDVYDRCAERSGGEYLCFVHEDVRFLTEGWGARLAAKLCEPDCGVIGFAGSVLKLRRTTAWQHGVGDMRIQIYQKTAAISTFIRTNIGCKCYYCYIILYSVFSKNSGSADSLSELDAGCLSLIIWLFVADYAVSRKRYAVVLAFLFPAAHPIAISPSVGTEKSYFPACKLWLTCLKYWLEYGILKLLISHCRASERHTVKTADICSVEIVSDDHFYLSSCSFCTFCYFICHCLCITGSAPIYNCYFTHDFILPLSSY